MGVLGVSKYPELVAAYAEILKTQPGLTVTKYCQERGIAFFEFCRHWAASEYYRPVLALDKRFSGEGEKAVDNLILSRQEIIFLQMAKAVTSPIRLAILRFLCNGPATLKEFITETRWAYNTAVSAIRHLERLGIVHVKGVQDSFNLYELTNKEAIVSILAGIEMLAESR